MVKRRTLSLLLVCSALLLAVPGVAAASEPNDAYPGVPIGIAGVSGVVDYSSDPYDLYAINLFEGQQVTFTVTRTDTSAGRKDWFCELYGPTASSVGPLFNVDDAQSLASEYSQYANPGESATFSYTPAVTGVYYFVMESIDDAYTSPAFGLGYRLTITGNASQPDNSTVWRGGAAPGSSLAPVFGKGTVLRGQVAPTFRDIGLPFTSGRLQQSADGFNWFDVTTIEMPSGVGYYTTPAVTSTQHYRFLFAGNGYYKPSTSGLITVRPRADVRTPQAPLTMKKSSYYSVFGYLKPRHASGTYPVRIYMYRKNSMGRWVSYGYVKAKASNYSTYTKYSRRIRLYKSGQWRLRAYIPAGSRYGASWSTGYDYVTVK